MATDPSTAASLTRRGEVNGNSRMRALVRVETVAFGDGGAGRALTGFTGAEEALRRTVDDMHIEYIEHLVEAQDRIAHPVAALDARPDRTRPSRAVSSSPTARCRRAIWFFMPLGIDRLA